MSFFKNLFNEATKFVEEHSKTLEKTFDELKGELGAKFNEALLAEQNSGNKTLSSQKAIQLLENADGATIKIITLDGTVISTSTKPFVGTDNYDIYYDFGTDAMQAFSVSKENNQITAITHQTLPYNLVQSDDFTYLYLSHEGIITVPTNEPIPYHKYKNNATEVEINKYSSCDFGFTTHSDTNHSFEIIEKLLSYLPASAKDEYAKHAERRQEKTNEIIVQQQEHQAIINAKEKAERDALITKNKDFALMYELSEKPLAGVQEAISKYGLPKETSFVTRTGKTIYFNGDLIYLSGNEQGQITGSAYLSFDKKNNAGDTLMIITTVYYENEKISKVNVTEAVAPRIVGDAQHEEYNAVIDANSYSNCVYVGLSAPYNMTYNDYYSEGNESNDYNESGSNFTFFLNSLEDAYTIAGRIFMYMSEYGQNDFVAYITTLQNGTFVKYEAQNEDESNDYQEDNNENTSNSSSNSPKKEKKKEEKISSNYSNAKAKNIAIKVKNDTDEPVHVYNLGSGGSYRLQKNIVTTIKMDEGDKLTQYGNNKRVYLVAEPSMDGKVQLISKL